MDSNTEFLEYIYQNSKMGIETINQLLDVVEDKEFAKHLHSQLHEYQEISKMAIEKLKQYGHEEKDIGAMQKITAYMTIGMKTLINKTPSHISEMMIQGSTMGIIEATKNINKYTDANSDVLSLANQLLKTEQNNVEQLKKFL